MMEFFEFFFSGPGWGWKVFALIFLISAVGEIVCKMIKFYFNYRVEKFKVEIIGALQEMDPEIDDDQSATIDDCR